MSSQDQATLARYALEVPIQAAPAKVWDALVERTNEWWLADFRILGPDSKVELEAVAGGRLVEQTESGAGLVWYTVQMVVPGKSLHLVGHTAPSWGGPVLSMLELVIEATDRGSVLKVSDALVGVTTEAKVESLKSGWKQLFGDGLSPYVQGSAAAGSE